MPGARPAGRPVPPARPDLLPRAGRRVLRRGVLAHAAGSTWSPVEGPAAGRVAGVRECLIEHVTSGVDRRGAATRRAASTLIVGARGRDPARRGGHPAAGALLPDRRGGARRKVVSQQPEELRAVQAEQQRDAQRLPLGRPAEGRGRDSRSSGPWNWSSRRPRGVRGGRPRPARHRRNRSMRLARSSTTRSCWRCSPSLAARAGVWPRPSGRALPDDLEGVGIDRAAGRQVPLDLEFIDEDGQHGHAGRLLRRGQAGAPHPGLLPLPDALHAGAGRHGRRAARAGLGARATSSRSSP